jgi:hypothetical protein
MTKLNLLRLGCVHVSAVVYAALRYNFAVPDHRPNREYFFITLLPSCATASTYGNNGC